MIEALARQGITYAEVTLGAGVVLWLRIRFRQCLAGDSRGAAGGADNSGRWKSGGIWTPSGSSARTM